MNGIIVFFRRWLVKIREWLKPDPADPLLLKMVKFLYKGIALLVVIAFSPVIIVVLLFVFLAAM